MSDNRFLTLLRGLKLGTDKNQIHWSELPEEEMFRAHVGSGMVRIGRTDQGDRKARTLWVLNGAGAEIAEIELREGDVDYQLIDDLFTSARLVARNGRQVLDSMLRTLPKEILLNEASISGNP